VSETTDELMARIRADVDRAMPFITKHGGEAWSSLKHLIGREAALELVEMPRNDLLTYLRCEYGYTLQAIGDVFGISRERVRQLTPVGLWRADSTSVKWDKIIARVARTAASDRAAWDKRGKITRPWVLSRFGEDIARHLPDIHRTINKLEMILLYRVGLPNRAACLEWLNTEYFRKGQGYAEIAQRLSHYIYISTMCVYRDAKALGFRGYSVGRRHDLAQGVDL